MGERIIHLNERKIQAKVRAAIQDQVEKKSKMYAGDFKRFEMYCLNEGLALSFGALQAYLLQTIESGLKLSTFNRRSAAIKHFLINVYGIDETPEQAKEIALLRQIYNDEQYAALKQIDGQSPLPKDELLHEIDKLDERAKAITLVNLITASRPSEMVTIKVGDFDLKDRSVKVYLKKQSEWKTKRLTLDCIKAIKSYVKKYNLQPADYFVGCVNKGDKYTSKQISDIAYRKAMHKWLECAPYTLRKTQVSAMHEAGADLATIAKQSGHKNLETINKHYLSVHDRTVDKFL